MAYVYVLQLEDNKYYIGKTTNPQFRLENHYTASGSAWTKKYSPIRVHEIRPDQTDHDEQRITQEYMEKYGIDNVRGGPWCQIDISKERVMIQKILNSGLFDKDEFDEYYDIHGINEININSKYYELFQSIPDINIT